MAELKREVEEVKARYSAADEPRLERMRAARGPTPSRAIYDEFGKFVELRNTGE